MAICTLPIFWKFEKTLEYLVLHVLVRTYSYFAPPATTKEFPSRHACGHSSIENTGNWGSLSLQAGSQLDNAFNWEHRKLLVQMASLVCFTGTKGIQFNRACPQLSHLLFADDAVFFLKASISECQNFSDLWCEDMVSTWAFHQIGGDLNGRCFLGSSVCNVSIYAPPFSLNPEIGCLVGDPCNPLSFFPQL